MALISRKLLQARPQELGKIKIGGLGREITSRKGTKFQPPVKFDHFVVTTRVRGDDGNFLRDDQIHTHPDVGESPTSLAGVLMYERPEENFHSEMAHYQGRSKDGKVSTCNGEEIVFLKGGRVEPCRKANGRECPCKPYGRFHLQLWAGPMLGYHTFRTTSWESTNNIQTALEEIYARFGTCLGAPVRLVVYPSEDRHDDGVSTSHKVGLVLAQSMEDTARQLAASRQYSAIASGTPLRQLAAGVQQDLAKMDEEEAELIAAEYFPEFDDQEVHATTIENALHAEDPEEPEPPAAAVVPGDDPMAPEPEPVQQKPPVDDRLNAKYFAMLGERGMSGDADRKRFQKRLLDEGKISALSCTDWSKTDYRSAIAELDEIPQVSDEPPPNDDDLFQD